jgi:hypothetical protein
LIGKPIKLEFLAETPACPLAQLPPIGPLQQVAVSASQNCRRIVIRRANPDKGLLVASFRKLSTVESGSTDPHLCEKSQAGR